MSDGRLVIVKTPDLFMERRESNATETTGRHSAV